MTDVSCWWCPTCNCVVPPFEVTYQETHEPCGTWIGETDPPTAHHDNQQPKVLNPPKEIWLNYGELDEDTEHSACGEVSWCYHEVDSTDVRYVLASEYEAVKAERDRLAEFATELLNQIPARTHAQDCGLIDSEGKPVGEWAKQETT